MNIADFAVQKKRGRKEGKKNGRTCSNSFFRRPPVDLSEKRQTGSQLTDHALRLETSELETLSTGRKWLQGCHTHKAMRSIHAILLKWTF